MILDSIWDQFGSKLGEETITFGIAFLETAIEKRTAPNVVNRNRRYLIIEFKDLLLFMDLYNAPDSS